MTTIEYRVAGMSCGHCEASVRREVSKVSGVDAVDVSAATGILRVGASRPLTDDDVLSAVDEAGYEAVRI